MPKLGAKWQLDAALLSRPVDLTALVSLSQTNPDAFFEDDTLGRMVKILLNTSDDSQSDKDTRLDVLTVLSNLSKRVDEDRRDVIRMALDGVNEWFDEYMAREEAGGEAEIEPELHKLMLLLLARLYEYKLRTEDLLELVRNDKVLALETVVGLLEDGETYSTELTQKQAPTAGKLGQWEHKLVCHRHEKPLVLQLCRLLRGFTLPSSYFGTSSEVTEHAVDDFTQQLNVLMDITLKSRLVEKVALACHECLFVSSGAEDLSTLEDVDHRSIACAHSFLQNLYFYAANRTEEFRKHLLADTLLIPRLVLPYLDRSVKHALELSDEAAAYHSSDFLARSEGELPGSDELVQRGRRQSTAREINAGSILDCPALVQGITASLRTLVVASFRAPATRFMLELLRRLNPTESLLRASSFVARHDHVFALLCLLNVNMGALDLSSEPPSGSSSTQGGLSCRDFYDNTVQRNVDDDDDTKTAMPAGMEDDDDATAASGPMPPRDEGAKLAHGLLHELASLHHKLDAEAQARVLQTVNASGALPVARDTPSFAAVMSVLLGGSARGQFDYAWTPITSTTPFSQHDSSNDELEFQRASRAEAKLEAKQRVRDSRDAKPVNPASPDSIADEKDQGQEGRFRLLGDLPSLELRRDTAVLRDVEIPIDGQPKEKNKKVTSLRLQRQTVDQTTQHLPKPDFPSEFACAINGHMLKEPLRSPYGHVFEKSTIILWLATRGSICPITCKSLTVDQLVDDHALRSRLVRWNIGRMKATMETSVSAMRGDEDDLYDF